MSQFLLDASRNLCLSPMGPGPGTSSCTVHEGFADARDATGCHTTVEPGESSDLDADTDTDTDTPTGTNAVLREQPAGT